MKGSREGRLPIEGTSCSQERRHRAGRSCGLHRMMFGVDVEVLYTYYKCSGIHVTLKLWSLEEGGGHGDR